MNKIRFGKIGLAMLLTTVVASTASAALPTDAAAAVTSISTFATDMIAAAWPIVSIVAVAAIGIKLFKKFVSKAT